MIDSYMGRQKVYCQCFEKNDFETLKIHLIKNVYRNISDFGSSPQLLTDYCESCFSLLKKTTNDSLLSNQFCFPEYKESFN
jgi:hypothetical protein